MKKLLTFLTLLTLFFTTAWAEEIVYYTLDGTITGGTNGYATESEITQNGISWKVMANTLEKPWRIGGKSLSNVDRLVYSKTAMGSAITKVSIETGTASDITVNSLKLIVASDAAFENKIDEVTGTFATNSTIYFYPTNGTEWATGAYYRIIFNVTVTNTSSNKFVQFYAANFYKNDGNNPTVATPTFSPGEGFYDKAQNVTISCTTEGATIHYTTDGNDPDASSTEYNSPIPVDETTTIKAIAVKEGMNNSTIANATYTFPKTVVVPPTYEESFASDFGKFYIKDKIGSNIWKIDNSYHYAKATGRVNGINTTTESWLISPYINLTNATNPQVSFTQAGNYFVNTATMQNDVKVMVKKQSDSDTQWNELTFDTWPNGTSWDWVDNTTSLTSYAGEVIQIAFKYTSTQDDDRAGTWEIKNFKIENVATKYSVTCNTAENGSISTDESEYVEGATVNVTVTPANGYELATLVYNDGEDHDIKDAKSFTMPASNVTVTATFSKVGDLYVMGNVNGIDVNGWHANQGVKMDFINGAYTADIWVTGKWNDEMQKNAGSFAFTKVLANNGSGEGAWGWVNGYGHRIQPSANDKYYWLNSGSVSNIPLYVRGDNDGEKEFLIPAGLYTITVTPADPSVQNDTWKFSLVEKDLKPTITPNGGDVDLNSIATVALKENYNDFIANCPKVTECTSVNGSDVYTELTLTLPEVKLYVNNDAVEGVSSDYEFTTAGSVTLTGKGALLLNDSEITSATKTATATFNVTEVDMSNVYTLVKSATDLVAGGEYLIVSSKGDDTYNVLIGEIGGTTAKPYATAIIEASIYDATRECITLPEGCLATPLTLGYDETTQKYTFYNGSGYLNSPADDNYLNTSSSISNTSQWIIDTNEFPASNKLIQNSERTTRYIAFNASSPRFACYAGTQQPVALFKKVSSTPTNKTATPVIAPDSKDVKGGLLEGITIAPGEENTNPAIWYTTDGSDPSNTNNAGRKQYTEPFNIEVTQGGPQTVMAIAIEEGKDPSNVVSVQYMFKNPDAPTFTPDPAVVQTGDFTITINSADGGTIYYVLDPYANEVPSNSQEVIDANNVYEDGVSVSGYDTHRIYAVVVLNGLKSTIANATYTVIETGAEGDWTLVTSADQIKAGREYIIVNSDRDRAIKSGALETSRFYSVECENNVVFGPQFATATVVGTDVRVFGFDTEGNNIYMKDADGSRYYNLSSGVSTGKQPVYISMSDGFVYIKGADDTKSLAYNPAYGNYFGMYATPTSTTGNQHPIYLYYYEINPAIPEVTLAELCDHGVKSDDENIYMYIITDHLIGVWADATNGVLWCKDQGNASIFKTSIKDGQVDFMKQQGVEPDIQGWDWDQSNWIALQFTAPNAGNDIDVLVQNLVGKYLKPVKGYLLDDVNYTFKVAGDNIDFEVPGEANYDYNVYCASNFLPDNLNIWGDERDGAFTTGSDQNYFFMNPKVQEVCHITWAQWDKTNKCFTVPTASGFDGAFQVGWRYNADRDLTDALEDEVQYEFNAVVQRTNKNAYGPKDKVTSPYAGITVLPFNLNTSSIVPVTAINTVETGNGEVKSVKYVNVAGIVSDRPFQGVNIVVTEYTDGSRTTSKMLKK